MKWKVLYCVQYVVYSNVYFTSYFTGGNGFVWIRLLLELSDKFIPRALWLWRSSTGDTPWQTSGVWREKKTSSSLSHSWANIQHDSSKTVQLCFQNKQDWHCQCTHIIALFFSKNRYHKKNYIDLEEFCHKTSPASRCWATYNMLQIGSVVE